MLNMTIPMLSVEKVLNGYVVQWVERIHKPLDATRSRAVSAVPADEEELIVVIRNALSRCEDRS